MKQHNNGQKKPVFACDSVVGIKGTTEELDARMFVARHTELVVRL